MANVTLRLINNRRGVGSENKPTSVELRIAYMRKVKYVGTGIKVCTNEWKNDMVVKHPDASILNRRLSEFVRKANRIIADMEENGMIDLEGIANLLKSNGTNMTFWEFIEKIANDKSVANGTRLHYENFLAKLKEWKKFRCFSDLTLGNVLAFDKFLHDYRQPNGEGYKQSTIYGYHKYLRQFIYDAKRQHLVSASPYEGSGISLDKGEAGIDKYLTEEELGMISKFPLTGTLARVRDLFVFASLTGLSFADLMALDKKKATWEGNICVIEGARIKTGKDFFIPVLPQAMEILEKYDWCLPKYSNQKYNLYLKNLAEIVGIEKPISSHYARHTAGMILLNNGVPIEVVSKILGHANIDTTQKYYAKVQKKTVSREIINNDRLKNLG